MRKLTPFALLLICVFAGNVQAETLSQQLQTCAQFSDDQKRLDCFDTLTGNLQQHAEAQFGQEEKAAIDEAPEAITAAITDSVKGAYGKYTFRLDNGQIWRQLDNTRIIWKEGEQVNVERGALGSFLMRNVRGGRTVRVKRIE